MRSTTLLLVACCVLASCDRIGCGGSESTAPADASAEAALDADGQGGDADPGGGEAGVRSDAAPRGDAGGPRHSPLTQAQRFLVGWASGRVAPLVELSDGEAAELVQRAAAGETVDTPLGRLTPDRPLARSFSFSERRASRIDDGHHRVEVSMTVRLTEGEPITTGHVVTVRSSDGKVVDWQAPSPPGDGGV